MNNTKTKPSVEWLVQVRRGIQKAHAFMDGADWSACGKVKDVCLGAAQTFDGRCTRCANYVKSIEEQRMKKDVTKDVRREAYDEMLKAMRNRQRTRRKHAVTHKMLSESNDLPPSCVVAGDTKEQHGRLARAKHHEADGMAELILMVKNMRDHGVAT